MTLLIQALWLLTGVMWIVILATITATRASKKMSWVTSSMLHVGVIFLAATGGLGVWRAYTLEVLTRDFLIHNLTGAIGLLCLGIGVILFHVGKLWKLP